MNYKDLLKKNNGVTMVELLISMSLFAVFIAIAVGGFVQAITNQRIALKLMAVTDNMSFPIEQMMREIRVGSDFYPISSPNTSESIVFNRAEGVPGGGVAEYQIKYSYDPDKKAIIRTKTRLINGSPTGELAEDRLTAEGVEVDSFKVITDRPQLGGPVRVTLLISISATDKGRTITNHIQTTVSARSF